MLLLSWATACVPMSKARASKAPHTNYRALNKQVSNMKGIQGGGGCINIITYAYKIGSHTHLAEKVRLATRKTFNAQTAIAPSSIFDKAFPRPSFQVHCSDMYSNLQSPSGGRRLEVS